MSTQDLVGLTQEEAEKFLDDNEVIQDDQRIIVVRVVAEDGEEFMTTMDFREDRVNVEVENGKITKVRGIK